MAFDAKAAKDWVSRNFMQHSLDAAVLVMLLASRVTMQPADGGLVREERALDLAALKRFADPQKVRSLLEAGNDKESLIQDALEILNSAKENRDPLGQVVAKESSKIMAAYGGPERENMPETAPKPAPSAESALAPAAHLTETPRAEAEVKPKRKAIKPAPRKKAKSRSAVPKKRREPR